MHEQGGSYCRSKRTPAEIANLAERKPWPFTCTSDVCFSPDNAPLLNSKRERRPFHGAVARLLQDFCAS